MPIQHLTSEKKMGNFLKAIGGRDRCYRGN